MTPLLAQRSRQDRQFERIYRRHAGDVYRYALAVLRNPDDAEDVTQTTFMNAYRAFQRGDRPEAPKNWLIAIAHNVCRQRFRQASRRPNEVEFVEETAPAPEEAEERYSIEDIQRALGQLAFNQRSALVMRELEGRSYSEIAGILGVTVGAVETLIFRARRALREQLEGSLSCAEAELALSRQADGMLPRAEKGALRAHLRECAACATAARRMRAQRGAFKALGAAPLPGPLVGWVSSLFGGSAAATGSALAVKAAAVTAAGLLVAGGGVEGKRLVEKHVATAPSAARAAAKPRPSVVAKAVSASSVVRAAPTVVRPPATKANGRSSQARAQRSSAVAKKGLGPRTGSTTKIAAGATSSSSSPDTRGQARSELAHATAAATAQERALTKPARTSPAHTAKATAKTTRPTPKTTPRATTPKATAKPAPRPTSRTKTTPTKTPPKKHEATRKPLRDDALSPATPPESSRPDASGSGRVNPHG